MKTITTLAILATVAALAVGCGETQVASSTGGSPAAQAPEQSAQAEPDTPDTFAYGQAADAGQLQISVSKPIQGSTPYFGQWTAVRAKVCATETGATINPFDFKARYANADLADADIGKEPALHDTTLAKGECAAGWVSYKSHRPIVGVKYEGFDADFDTVIATWGK